MPRTFEQALRPPFEKPDASYMADILCDTCAQRIEAEANTLKVQICGSRKAELFYNESVGISPEDRGRIESVLGRNFDEKPETRSLWLPLNEPIDACNLPFGKGISCIQIKGVVFDASNSPTSYGGVGWPREAFFADRSGILQRHASANDDAMGRCSTEEAVNEYLMCARTAQYFEPEGIYVPFPVGWGTFQVPGDTKDDFGFVILGLPDLIPGREAVYLNAAEELQNTHDFSRMGRLLCLRSDAMRTANKNGFVVPYRHFGNISLTTDNGLFMHDMGTQHSLFEESFSSRRQLPRESLLFLCLKKIRRQGRWLSIFSTSMSTLRLQVIMRMTKEHQKLVLKTLKRPSL
jgi:hypothetical protein